MKKTILYATIATAAAIAAMAVIGCNNGAGGDGGERVNSYLSRFDPPNSGDGGGTWTSIYTLETNVYPAGGGTVTRDPNNDTYEAGTRVTIVAAAIDGYTFTGWTVTDGSVVDNAGSPSTYVIVNGNVTVTANFEETPVIPTYTLTVSHYPTDGGSTTPSGNQSDVIAGTPVAIYANPATGYTFSNWKITFGSRNGSIANENNAFTSVTVNGDVTVTANFTQGGTFTDGRDGKTYRKVTLGGKEWMAENLNYETGNSWCYDCGKYGRLYDWSTAMTACPSGWHLPSSAEWEALMAAVGGSSTAGKKLKSTSGWYNNGNGTDEYGFSALPGGYRYSDGLFGSVGYNGGWWTATEGNASNAYYRGMGYGSVNVYLSGNDKSYAWSVRCVRDD